SRSSSCFWNCSALTLSFNTRWVSTMPTVDPVHCPGMNATPTASNPTRSFVMPASPLSPDAGDELVGGVERARRGDRLGEHDVPLALLGQPRRLDARGGEDQRVEPRPVTLGRQELILERADPFGLGPRLRLSLRHRLGLGLPRGVDDGLLLPPEAPVEFRLRGLELRADAGGDLRGPGIHQALPVLVELRRERRELVVGLLDLRLLELLQRLLVRLLARGDLLVPLLRQRPQLFVQLLRISPGRRLHVFLLQLEVEDRQPVLRQQLLLVLLAVL